MEPEHSEEMRRMYVIEVQQANGEPVLVLCQPIALVSTLEPNNKQGTYYHLWERLQKARPGPLPNHDDEDGRVAMAAARRRDNKVDENLDVKHDSMSIPGLVDGGGGSIVTLAGPGPGNR